MSHAGIRILGIETSCDETAVAIVRNGRTVEANVIASQTDLHQRFGGVVPEQASRAHLQAILPALDEARTRAQCSWDAVDAIAVTHGPGLAGALLVGLNVAKGLAFARRKPILGINHLEGHVYANWLDTAVGHASSGERAASESAEQPEPTFPLVALIVSGGHSDVVLMRGHGDYRRLGKTRDDAAGEAFDKVARILGLGFPGGPLIERAAREGNAGAFRLPRAWLEPESWDFSFSGLKTAVLHQVQALAPGISLERDAADERRARLPVADLAASFQEAVVEVLATKAVRAAEAYGARQLALGGGVAANRRLLERVREMAAIPVLCPPPMLCTDNGAMVAAAGYFRYQAGQRDSLDLDVVPTMPIA